MCGRLGAGGNSGISRISGIASTSQKSQNPKKVLLDYGGPNIGKPLHVGHLRSLNIGRSLYNMYKLAGHNVISDIHFF